MENVIKTIPTSHSWSAGTCTRTASTSITGAYCNSHWVVVTEIVIKISFTSHICGFANSRWGGMSGVRPQENYDMACGKFLQSAAKHGAWPACANANLEIGIYSVTSTGRKRPSSWWRTPEGWTRFYVDRRLRHVLRTFWASSGMFDSRVNHCSTKASCFWKPLVHVSEELEICIFVWTFRLGFSNVSS